MDIKSIALGSAITVILLVVVFGVIGTPQKSNEITGNVALPSGDYQEVKLSFENYQYKLEPSTFVKDVPVKMIVDMNTVYGCMRDVVIPAFGVKQYVSEGNNIIEFTPTKTGTFNIACSMNMGRGTFTVVEADGSKSAYVEAAKPTSAGSCGSGGCGCGA